MYIGKNRSDIHSNAKRGSGGVGIFIKQTFLNNYDFKILDDKNDDILWIKFWNGDDNLCICVCYLPPQGSSKDNCEESFFTLLTEQVYSCVLELLYPLNFAK